MKSREIFELLINSAPEIWETTCDRLIAGDGEREAKTPTRVLPPSLGGRTVGENFSLFASEKPHITQTCEYFSSPIKDSLTPNSPLKIKVAKELFATPLCLGTPNLVGKLVFK